MSVQVVGDDIKIILKVKSRDISGTGLSGAMEDKERPLTERLRNVRINIRKEIHKIKSLKNVDFITFFKLLNT